MFLTSNFVKRNLFHLATMLLKNVRIICFQKNTELFLACYSSLYRDTNL